MPLINSVKIRKTGEEKEKPTARVFLSATHPNTNPAQHA